jgi:DNA-binding GntR family transcriptional regulator
LAAPVSTTVQQLLTSDPSTFASLADLLTAISNHDGDTAEAVARRHVLDFERAIRDVI